jgi:hypothetical protein
MEKPAPNLFIIARKDFYSSYVLIFFIITLLIYGALSFFAFPLKFSPHYLLILALIEMIVIFWRANIIKRLISFGISVEGTIERIYKTGASGSGSIKMVQYSFIYNGKQFKRNYPNRKGLEQGQKITVKIDPDNFQKSIIENIFY